MFRTLISVYALILLIRIILYIQLVKYCDALSSAPQENNHFGMFLGNIFRNKGVSILVTLIIIILILLCFSLSVTSIRYLGEVEDIVAKRA